MNNSVKVDKLLAELKDNIAVAGKPEFENTRDGFYNLCRYVTDWMLRKYNLDTDDQINYGYCFIWAYLVHALWPYDGLTFKTCTGHVVVVKDGLYYDSEHTDGHSDLNKFCSFPSRSYDGIVHVALEEMCWYWARAGRQLKEFRRIIRKVQPALYKQVRDNGKCNWRNSIEDFIGYHHIKNLKQVS